MVRPVKELLIANLKSEKIVMGVSAMAASLSLSTDDESKLTIYFTYKISSLIESMQDVCLDDDESEVQRLLSHVWIEYRMEWIRYNAQMQYQTVTLGQANPLLMGIGAALSSLLGIIEQYLPSDELYWCTKLAYDPIGHMSSRVQLTSRISDIAGAIGVAGHQVIERFVQVKESLREQFSDSGFDNKMEKVIEDVENLLSSSMALPSSDLANSFEMILAKTLKESPVQIVINRDLASDEIPVPAETVHGLNQLFESWLKELIKHSIEISIEQRQAAGKTDHVQIQWKMNAHSNGSIFLTFSDDGCGTLNYTPNFALPPDWKIQSKNNPAKNGSELRVNFKSSQSTPLMHFSVFCNDQPFPFVVPISHVIQIFQSHQIVVRNDLMSFATAQGELMPLIDLSRLLGLQDSAKSKLESRIYVKIKASNEHSFLLSIDEVFTQVRGTTRTGPVGTPFFIEGFILLSGSLVPVINVNKLLEIVHDNHLIAKAA